MTDHPPWSGDRVPLAVARRSGGPVAGRYLRGATRDLIQDASAVIELAAASPRPDHGDLVCGILEPGALRLTGVRVLTPARREPAADAMRLLARAPLLRQRAAILAAMRQVFDERGFLEVSTPARVRNPGLEPHLRPFRTDGADGERMYLITSPELHLKRMLAAGYERVFELARCWRDEEHGDLHAAEFTMLEWYRAYAGLDAIADDIASLLPRCAEAAGVHPARAIPRCDLSRAPEVIPYREAFEQHARRSPDGLSASDRQVMFSSAVEPRLGRGRPTLVVDWPEDEAALARVRPDAAGRRVAARMELYIAGREIANAFDELTDAEEQRRRHEADQQARRAAGTEVPPLDEPFLEALASGMPPSAGIALGVDRLVMLILGARSVADVQAFPS